MLVTANHKLAERQNLFQIKKEYLLFINLLNFRAERLKTCWCSYFLGTRDECKSSVQ
jgi:hypothetical protein